MKSKIYILAFAATLFQISFGQSYPPGFSQVATGGFLKPTNLAFAPNGRIFICEQGGRIRVVKNDGLLIKPFISLAVDSSGERGLLGVAFDPNFVTNKWVYIYYTLPGGSNNRIIRVKADGDTAITSTIEKVLDLDPLSSATNHNGGTIKFGEDGKLYVAVGENANGANGQNLDTYLGKLLRINPDGSVPDDNPYTTGSKQRKRIWCYGLRNPYTFDVEPGTGKIYVNDVGQSTWEEINNATQSNRNFGWPNAEGNSNIPGYKDPLFAYKQNASNPDKGGCAITGGAFFSPANTNYPSKYIGNYFFMDLCNNWINRIETGDVIQRHIFATNVGGSNVALNTGKDGNLYFLSRDAGVLYKIIYTSPLDENTNKIAGKKSLPGAAANKTSLYPSPASTTITLETGSIHRNNVLLQIFDSRGVLVKNIQPVSSKTIIDVSSFSNGSYYAIINNGSNVEKVRFEVIH